MKWTDEQIEILKRDWAANVPVNQIVDKLGMTKGAVLGKKHRLGLKDRKGGNTVARIKSRKPPTPPRPVEILNLQPTSTLMEISEDECRYIDGITDGCETPMCGREVVSGTRWCAIHLGVITGGFK